MGICNLITGTLLTVLSLFLLPPASLKLSNQQLVDERQPVMTVDYAVGYISPIEATVCLVTMIQVRPIQLRVRGYEMREEEGNVQDGYVLHFPAPTQCNFAMVVKNDLAPRNFILGAFFNDNFLTMFDFYNKICIHIVYK